MIMGGLGVRRGEAQHAAHPCGHDQRDVEFRRVADGQPRNPKGHAHPRLQDFPRWKKTPKNTGWRRIAWRQESGGGDKFLAAGSQSGL